MDASRVCEIERYAARAPRETAKVILELLADRREKQAAFLGMMTERDALTEERRERDAAAGRLREAWYAFSEHDGVNRREYWRLWDAMEDLIDALAPPAPEPDSPPADGEAERD